MRVTVTVQLVSYNMHVAPPDIRAGVFLRTEHFALVAQLLDLRTDAALSRAIGMDRITISRAREGVIGERFIAAVLKAFGERAEELKKFDVSVKFEDLFTIGDKS
jgi:hypothetical protein